MKLDFHVAEQGDHVSIWHMLNSVLGYAEARKRSALLRILYQGKILQDVLTISDLKQLPGKIIHRLVTLHLVVAPPGQLTGSTSRRKANETTESTCCCIQ